MKNKKKIYKGFEVTIRKKGWKPAIYSAKILGKRVKAYSWAELKEQIDIIKG